MANVEIKGMRVLVMPLPPAMEIGAELLQVVQAGKRQAGWHVDVMCEAKDREKFVALTEDGGRIFIRPDLLDGTDDAEIHGDDLRDIERKLADAELKTSIPAGKIALAGESTIGRAFVLPARYMPASVVASRVFGDNTLPFLAIRRMYWFAEKMLEECNPDLILTYDWGKPWRLTVKLAAKRLGIPCYVLRRSKILSARGYFTDDLLMFNTASTRMAESLKLQKSPVSDEANRYLSEFRDSPKVVKYIQTKWQRRKEQSWIGWHKDFAMTVPRQILRAFDGKRSEERASLVGQVVGYNRRRLATIRQESFFQEMSEDELASTKYLYPTFPK